ncbi:MAG: hypothetical protein OEO77_07805 [Acidimicrobiia bacterium]|nr:hypothetical protein [Acidimicrobiia bacterium]
MHPTKPRTGAQVGHAVVTIITNLVSPSNRLDIQRMATPTEASPAVPGWCDRSMDRASVQLELSAERGRYVDCDSLVTSV